MSGNVKPGYARAIDIKRGRIDLGHGGGGRAMVQLVRELFARHLGNPWLDQGNDGTLLPPVAGRLVVSTDSHVVSPLFFP
ncbi:MAG: hydrogenase expression/formation protein HypE, partial [Betaproteobacteria bacterium]